MNYHMTKEEILAVLQKAGKVDLSIPESVRLAIPKNKVIAPYVQSIQELADKYRGTPIPSLPYSYFKLFHETGDRWFFEDSDCGYFPRRGRLAAFGALAWLYQREEDIHELEDIIWAICDEYTWTIPACLGPEKFTDTLEYKQNVVALFSAETADALSEISFLLGDKLSPIIKKRIAYLTEERVFSQVLRQTFWWMSGTNNWAAVCAGSVGMAGIYAIEDDEHLAEVLARMFPAFETFLSGFSEDGACLEGIGYWNYGFSYFVSFADLLYRRTNGMLDMFDDPRVKKIAHFQQKCYFKGGRSVSFSDGGNRAGYLPGLTSYLCRKYDTVILPPITSMNDFNSDHCYRWSNVLRNLLWCVEEADDSKIEYGCYPLPAAQWYLCSSGNGVGLAAKGGHNDEPHNHNDVGGIQMFCNGEEVLADLGSGEYTRQYFREERYDYFVCSSRGHSVPMIDGCTQHAGKDACAVDFTCDDTGISMDIAPAYKLDFMPSLTRDIRFDRATGTVTLKDIYTFTTGEHEVRERFITRGTARNDGQRVIVDMNGESLCIHYDPAFFAVEINCAQYNAHFGIVHPLLTIDFVAKAEGTLQADFIISKDDDTVLQNKT